MVTFASKVSIDWIYTGEFFYSYGVDMPSGVSARGSAASVLIAYGWTE
jgi:hypothetical protein